MDSTRPIPFQAAVAYGMKLRQANAPQQNVIKPPVAGTSPAAKLAAARVDTRPANGRAPDRASFGDLGLDGPTPGSAAPSGLRGGASPNPTGSLQMYTRAADRMEVATAVRLGRMVDVRA
jgi:hypothetical protein